jgi:hypothetical protein
MPRISPGQLKIGVAAIVLVVVVAGALWLGNPAGPLAPIEPMPPPTGTVSQIPIIGSGQRYLFLPVSARVRSGVKYRYALPTHCGIDYPTGPDFDGSFWDSVDAAQRHVVVKPPAGFATPVDDGYILLVSAGEAEFHGSRGATARYTRRKGAFVAGLCQS